MLSLFSTSSDKAGFRLQYMEVFNWGTFDEKVFRINPQGNNSLLTGANASGKSTYIDALLTLIVPAKRDRFYNQSSGVEKKGDRTEETYVLGHYGNIQEEGKGFELLSQSSDGNKRVAIDYLIDARIPRTSLNSESAPLYRSLSEQGVVRPFQNKNATYTYRPGCMDLDTNGHPIGKNGSPIQDITVYGTPTEGVVYDNDTLSRRRNDFASGWAKETTDAIKKHFKLWEKIC